MEITNHTRQPLKAEGGLGAAYEDELKILGEFDKNDDKFIEVIYGF